MNIYLMILINPKVKSIFTQVGFDVKENDFVFSSEFEGNYTTQVNIPILI